MGNRLREISIRLIRPTGLRQGEEEQNKKPGAGVRVRPTESEVVF